MAWTDDFSSSDSMQDTTDELLQASSSDNQTASYLGNTSTEEYDLSNRIYSHGHPLFGPFDRIVQEMPLFGSPGPLFLVIHVSAVVSLSVSALVNMGLLVKVCVWRRKNLEIETSIIENGGNISTAIKQTSSILIRTTVNARTGLEQTGSRTTFWNWTSGERLVVYLAISDLTYSVFHIMDKAYYAYTAENPPDLFCSVIGFFFQTSALSQWLIVFVTAISAASLVVLNKKLDYGTRDWKLISVVFGIPAVNGIIVFFLGLLGQSGAWCYIDLRTRAGRTYSQVLSSSQILMGGVMALAYGAIWIKIKRTTMTLDANTSRYRNSASVMLIFVVTFFTQWWSLIMFNAWNMFATPPSFLPIMTGILVNLGGVYDFVAYTVIRRRLHKHSKISKPKTVTRRGTNVMTSSVSLTMSDDISHI